MIEQIEPVANWDGTAPLARDGHEREHQIWTISLVVLKVLGTPHGQWYRSCRHQYPFHYDLMDAMRGRGADMAWWPDRATHGDRK